MQTVKQEALEAIQRLPDDVDMEAVMYRLYVLENVRNGQRDAAEGNTYTAAEVLGEIETW